ncbi:clustered mitochondria-domain-containing protein [Hyaloraphidium curvatum]|nr:clustered mitochondria-domain-containing protein [Hyaloraphidium curvatum]
MAVETAQSPSSGPDASSPINGAAAHGTAKSRTRAGHDAPAAAAGDVAPEDPDAAGSDGAGADAMQAEEPDVPPLTLKVRPPDGEVYEVTVNAKATVAALRELFTEELASRLCTSFSLTLDGVDLADSLELTQIEGLENGSTLVMKEELYSEHGIHFHLVRFREILEGSRSLPLSQVLQPGISIISHVGRGLMYRPPDSPSSPRASPKRSPGRRGSPTGSDGVERHAFTSYDVDVPFNLSTYIPSSVGKPNVECLEYIKLSPWNPPTRQRKLAGDFLYLLAKTYEGKVYHITASVSGFHVNKSTDESFDPRKAPSGAYHHTLPGLLSKLSPIFKANFAQQIGECAQRPLLESHPVHPEAIAFALPAAAPSEDTGRLLDLYIQGLENTENNVMRDYHEELQASRELPKATAQDRMGRDGQFHRVMTDFTEAAAKSVVNIVEGNILPLDPSMPEDRRVTVHNSMIFSQGPDNKDTFDKIGGAEAWHVIMSKEVQGTKVINDLDVKDLFTMGTAVVEYKGRRFVAQTLIPGFLTKEKVPPVVHGYIDEEKRVVTDEQMASLFDEVGRRLHLAKHVVVDAEGKEHDFRTSVETKGIRGSDSRNYILDLYRLQPVDVLFLEAVEKEESTNPYPHKLCLIRHEVTEQYYFNQARKQLAERRKEREKAGEANGEPKANGTKENKQITEDENVIDIGGEEDEEFLASFEVNFDPDAFNPQHVSGRDEEERGEAEEKLRELSSFLHNQIIPEFCQEAVNPSTSLNSALLDEEQLRNTMHTRGINMRFLGTVLHLLRELGGNDQTKYLEELLLHEMVIRAFKRVVFRAMGSSSPLQAVQCIAHLLNCLFGPADVHPQVPAAPEVYLRPSIKSNSAYCKYSVAGLWADIRSEIRARFRHQLESDFVLTRRLPVLRSICKRLGLQIAAREYDWNVSSGQIFAAEDILNMYPVAKSPPAKATFAEDLFEAAKMAVGQGQYKYSLELLQEAASAYEQTYGTVHPDIARPFALLSALQSQSNEKAEQELSAQNQLKVATIFERTLGLENHETVSAYVQLGGRFLEIGDHMSGLNYLRHAVELMEMLVCSQPHPELYSLYSKIGSALQHQAIKDLQLANTFLERARRMSEICFGADHPFTAHAHHNLAINYLLLNDFKKAMTEQKIAYRIFTAKFGEKDERSQEAFTWLNVFTQQAVNQARAKAPRSPVEPTDGVKPLSPTKPKASKPPRVAKAT